MSNINGIGSQYASSNTGSTAAVNNAVSEKAEDKAAQEQGTAAQQDVVEIGKDAQQPVDAAKQVYTRDTARINYLKAVTENNANTLRQMVHKLLATQGSVAGDLVSPDIWNATDHDLLASFGLKLGANNTYELGIEIDAATREEAAALVDEDGPLGVKQVSEGILSFAKALSGGDPSKIDALQKAVQQGFDQAAGLFGDMDKMPSITQKTYDAVMKGFEEWKNGTVASDEG